MRDESQSMTHLADFQYLYPFQRYSPPKSEVVQNYAKFCMFWPCCCLQEDFSGNVAVFNVYNWRHSESSSKNLQLLLRIKFPIKRIFQIFNIWKTNRMTLFCNLFIERPLESKFNKLLKLWQHKSSSFIVPMHSGCTVIHTKSRILLKGVVLKWRHTSLGKKITPSHAALDPHNMTSQTSNLPCSL